MNYLFMLLIIILFVPVIAMGLVALRNPVVESVWRLCGLFGTALRHLEARFGQWSDALAETIAARMGSGWLGLWFGLLALGFGVADVQTVYLALAAAYHEDSVLVLPLGLNPLLLGALVFTLAACLCGSVIRQLFDQQSSPWGVLRGRRRTIVIVLITVMTVSTLISFACLTHWRVLQRDPDRADGDLARQLLTLAFLFMAPSLFLGSLFAFWGAEAEHAPRVLVRLGALIARGLLGLLRLAALLLRLVLDGVGGLLSSLYDIPGRFARSLLEYLASFDTLDRALHLRQFVAAHEFMRRPRVGEEAPHVDDEMTFGVQPAPMEARDVNPVPPPQPPTNGTGVVFKPETTVYPDARKM